MTLISDFNISILGRYFTSQAPKGVYQVLEAPFGEVIGSLMGFTGEPEKDSIAFVWVRPESISLGYRKALGMEVVDTEECLAEIDFFAEAVLKAAQTLKHCFVASFALPPDHNGYGILDWRPGLGITQLLARLNLRLAEMLRSAGNVYVLDSERWLRTSLTPTLPKLWYAAKIPFANPVFQLAASDLVGALATLAGASRRLILLDLDNTLWGGVIGETGWQGIRLGGHDHIGEAHKAFQEKLLAMTKRGVQLALVSKNEEDVALEAIDKHPEMSLRRKDIAGWRINWQDKAQNILDLLAELNLGPASAVFIDDSPVERDRIRSAFPDLLVPEWPEDPCFYAQAFDRLRCFDTADVSREDRRRTEMYVSNKARRELQAGSMENWLAQLGTRISVEPVGKSNISRVDQLFNKTNQLNLATRRLTGEEILAWSAHPDRCILACSVSDKFGDLGLTGIIAVEAEKDEARLVDYILSCRVMGRKVEETLIHLAVDIARKFSAKRLLAVYHPTERNAPAL
ncbi:MAG: HAD-IIIC family phosphatase [Fibrobacterota bacterium]|nr:HAD-IIIC family phosphatase [Fibrobacterota bacterium]